MSSKVKESASEKFDVNDLMSELWSVEEKIRALGMLFTNFNPHSMIENPKRLAGIGAILSETSDALRKTILKLDDPDIELRRKS